MLALTLKVGERIRIRHDGQEGWLTAHKKRCGRLAIRFDFPIDFEIDREQIAVRKDEQDD